MRFTRASLHAHPLSKIRAIACATFKEALRDRLVAGALTLLFAAFAVGAKVETDRVAVLDLALSLVGALGTLVAIFLATSHFHKELDKRTLYVVLAKPVGRAEFLLGKYVGVALALLVLTSLMGLGVLVLQALVGGGSPATLLVLGALLGQFWLVGAIALCFASVTNGLLAAVYAAGLFLVGQQALMIRDFGVSEAKVNQANHVLGQALYYVLPNFGVFDLKNAVLYAHVAPVAAWGWASVYGLCVSLASLLVASVAWERRELP